MVSPLISNYCNHQTSSPPEVKRILDTELRGRLESEDVSLRELGHVESVDLLEAVEGLGRALQVRLSRHAPVTGADLAKLAKDSWNTVEGNVQP